MHHPVLATVITQSQMHVQMKHSPEHLENLILTLASELFLSVTGSSWLPISILFIVIPTSFSKFKLLYSYILYVLNSDLNHLVCQVGQCPVGPLKS